MRAMRRNRGSLDVTTLTRFEWAREDAVAAISPIPEALARERMNQTIGVFLASGPDALIDTETVSFADLARRAIDSARKPYVAKAVGCEPLGYDDLLIEMLAELAGEALAHHLSAKNPAGGWLGAPLARNPETNAIIVLPEDADRIAIEPRGPRYHLGQGLRVRDLLGVGCVRCNAFRGMPCRDPYGVDLAPEKFHENRVGLADIRRHDPRLGNPTAAESLDRWLR